MLSLPDDIIESKTQELIAHHPTLAPETARGMARELVASDLGLGHHVIDEWRKERSRTQAHEAIENVDARAEATEIYRQERAIADALDLAARTFPKHAHLFRRPEEGA